MIVQGTDPAGNTATREFTVSVVQPAAPVLTPAIPSLSLGTTNVNAPVTVKLANFINTGAGTATTIKVSNPNAVAGGIAVTGTADVGTGTWAYSTNGGSTFQTISAVSASSALLLPQNAELRYTPDGTHTGTASITYRAWDATSGSAGTEVSTANNGGTTAFSSQTDTASLTVASTQDNVVLTTASPSLGSTTASSTAPIIIDVSKFINNGAGTTTIATSPASDAKGIALVGVSGSGTWQYSTNGGIIFTTITLTLVSKSSALLLSSTAELQYTPTSENETPTITYYGWDASSGTSGGTEDLTTANALGGATAFSLFSDTASLIVNTAPVLKAAGPSLGSLAANSISNPLTVGLTSFINNVTGTTTITDADTCGIAVTGTGIVGTGTWAYSTNNGSTFQSISAVSAGSALLLPNNAQLRYTPDGASTGTASITYYAWDPTISGVAGDRANLSLAPWAALRPSAPLKTRVRSL